MRYLLFAMAVLTLIGCNRAASLTTLNPDGSLHETVSLKISDMQGMFAFANVKVGGSKPKADSFAKAFRFDKAGARVTRSKEADCLVLTLERDFPAGYVPHRDFQILSDSGVPETDSQIKGIKLPSGDIEYDAIIKYLGPSGRGVFKVDPSFRALVKSALPTQLRDTAKIDGVSHAIYFALMRALLGPPEPAITSLVANPDENSLRFGSGVLAALESEPLGYLSKEQLRTLVRKVLRDQKVTDPATDKKTGEPGGDTRIGDMEMSGMTALLYEVSFKGSVVETNGILDSLTGHVYWSFYSSSAVLGEIKLHLVVKPA